MMMQNIEQIVNCPFCRSVHLVILIEEGLEDIFWHCEVCQYQEAVVNARVEQCGLCKRHALLHQGLCAGCMGRYRSGA